MNRVRIAIGWFWIIAGTAALIGGVPGLKYCLDALRQHHTADFSGSAFLGVFNVIAVIAGCGVLRRKLWAFPLLCVDCVLGFLSGALYVCCLILGLAQQYTDWLYGTRELAFGLASLATPILWAVSRGTQGRRCQVAANEGRQKPIPTLHKHHG